MIHFRSRRTALRRTALRPSRPPLWIALSVVLLALLPTTAVAGGPAEAAAGRTYTNPVKVQKGADPWLQYHAGNYHLVASTFTGEITMRKSPTLEGLSTAPSVRVWSDDTPSRSTNIWAPEMHFVDGRWYLYYSAAQAGSACCDSQRTHVLQSAGSDPMGPYTYKNILTGANLVPGGWLIDASLLRVGERLYLLGSGFVNGSRQSLVIAPLSNPYTLSGPFRVISSPTLSWEGQGGSVNEGPEPLYHEGRTFLTYSASSCNTPDYKLGRLELTGADPLSAASWTKAPAPVFQRSDAAGVYGPGHNGFFTSPDGRENWLVYHANDTTAGGCDNRRTTRAQKFTWRPDGTPDFGSPVAAGTPLPAPAGETGTAPAAYTLVNPHSGKCLDLANGSSADGADVRLWSCNGSAAQKWRFEDQGDDTSRLTNAASGKVLDVADCSTADGAELRQWTWLDNACQRFRLIAGAGGLLRLENAHSGKVADVADCGTRDGTEVRQWTRLAGPCQEWQLRTG
ncbi:family 43 glycosylhydrolase [Streptomyces sp. NPDC048257]|uniref:family 43 glycosylhydrolase n=1 Tax=Streptomyces sp. NPDC048257 TaxID=3365526 RepID=UPI00371D9016